MRVTFASLLPRGTIAHFANTQPGQFVTCAQLTADTRSRDYATAPARWLRCWTTLVTGTQSAPPVIGRCATCRQHTALRPHIHSQERTLSIFAPLLELVICQSEHTFATFGAQDRCLEGKRLRQDEF